MIRALRVSRHGPNKAELAACSEKLRLSGEQDKHTPSMEPQPPPSGRTTIGSTLMDLLRGELTLRSSEDCSRIRTSQAEDRRKRALRDLEKHLSPNSCILPNKTQRNQNLWRS